MREQDDDRAEERICRLSWADELWLYQCHWWDSLHRSTIEVHLICSVQLSDAPWTRNEAARHRMWAQGAEDKKELITCYSMNRVDLRNDLIGDDYSAAVEMMDSDDVPRGR